VCHAACDDPGGRTPASAAGLSDPEESATPVPNTDAYNTSIQCKVAVVREELFELLALEDELLQPEPALDERSDHVQSPSFMSRSVS
jgi:hypothetical protein